MAKRHWLGIGLGALAAGLTVNALLGPLVAGVIEYRFSFSVLAQTIGFDAFTLAVVVPVSVAAVVLVLRGHRAGAIFGLAAAVYAVYMFPQAIIGPDYVWAPGNNERFFPLHLGLFTLGVWLVIATWTSIQDEQLPSLTPRGRRLASTGLFVLATFVIGARWVPALVDIWSGAPTASDYLDNPTMVWIIGLLDLGLAAPAALAAGVGLRLRARWAQPLAYGVVAWFALVGGAVAAMSIAGYVTDANTTAGQMAAFVIYGAVFLTLGVRVHSSLFRRQHAPIAPARRHLERAA